LPPPSPISKVITVIDRRRLMIASAAAAALAPVAARADGPAAAGTPEGAKMNKLLDGFIQEMLDHSPEAATGFGLDTGPRAAQRGQLDDGSLAATEDAKKRLWADDDKLHTINRAALSPAEKVTYDTIAYVLDAQAQDARTFPYAGGGVGGPYVVSQLTGNYQQIPDFLDSQHPVESAADADAYLSRLKAFATVLDQDCEQVRHDAGMGVFAPDFILDKALIQLAALRDVPPEKSNLVNSVVNRAKAKGLTADYATPATKIYTGEVQPALDRQIALLKELRAKATHDAGVWRLPKGEEYYARSLRQGTTTDLSPKEVHELGLERVRVISEQIDADLKKLGRSQGTVGERLRGLYDDPQFRYPNTDEGKEKLLVDLNKKVEAVSAKLPGYFKTLPKAKLLIKRVPKATEAGAPGGYYQGASLDGSRPGMYYINLRDTAEVPSWTLSTLTYHEGIPGHHLQISIAQEAPLPLFRRIIGFSSYQEGWALYAEQLADEMGMYADDPYGRIGYLHDALFRGVRLVVDTGYHQMRWSREEGIKYYVDHLGDKEASAITECERYCVWPGQACSYMVGKLTWLRLRAKAKKEMGPRFDIHTFHDAALTNGAMPLAVLGDVIEGYIKG
jgi:uncharacterized protein (DUF885 family)